MTPAISSEDITQLLQFLTPEEQAELDALLTQDTAIWLPLPGPQSDAYWSEADIVGYGGAAGGGKSDLVAGRILTKHKRALVIRREKAQTEGIIQRLTQIIGNSDGFNSQKAIWRVPVGHNPLVEFGGLDNPGDERRWQGRSAHQTPRGRDAARSAPARRSRRSRPWSSSRTGLTRSTKLW